MKITKKDANFIISLVFAVWFALIGMAWAYWAALILGYPFGIISFLLWRRGRKVDEKSERYKIVIWILAIGLALSLTALILIN